jgi:hypothetical protein
MEKLLLGFISGMIFAAAGLLWQWLTSKPDTKKPDTKKK